MSDLDVPEVKTSVQVIQEAPQSDRGDASLPQFNLQPHPKKGRSIEHDFLL